MRKPETSIETARAEVAEIVRRMVELGFPVEMIHKADHRQDHLPVEHFGDWEMLYEHNLAWLLVGGWTGKGALIELVQIARAEARRAALEEAAQLCDAYADVNIEAATDSVLHDPCLHGQGFTRENIARSEKLMIDGCVHSSMFHAARNIAEALRALTNRVPA